MDGWNKSGHDVVRKRVEGAVKPMVAVMPALVAGIHVFLWQARKTWTAGTSPAMTP